METSNYVPGVRRRQVTPLYDTLTLALGAAVGAKRVFFGTTAGAVGINNTNLLKEFELPGQEAFRVMAMRLVVLTAAYADLVSLAQNYVLRLIRGRAVELEAPIEYFAGGAGIHGFATTTAAATTIQTFNNGVPDPRAVASLGDWPILIEGADHFEVNLEGTSFATTAALSVRVYLDGWFDKGVQ